MKSPNMYEESGNVIMRGTKEYERALKTRSKNNNNSSNFKSLKKPALIKKFHELVDPDHTEDVSGETKAEIIERIENFMKDFSGGRRRTRKAGKKYGKTRKY